MTNIWDVSDPILAMKKAKKYLGDDTILYLSDRKDKKYYVINPQGKKIHFGSKIYEDFTKHKNKERRIRYLKRATKIKGDWKDDPYSPNNLSINILW